MCPPNSLVSQMDSPALNLMLLVELFCRIDWDAQKKGHSVCTSSLHMVVSAYHDRIGRSTLTSKKIHTSDLKCMLNKA